MYILNKCIFVKQLTKFKLQLVACFSVYVQHVACQRDCSLYTDFHNVLKDTISWWRYKERQSARNRMLCGHISSLSSVEQKVWNHSWEIVTPRLVLEGGILLPLHCTLCFPYSSRAVYWTKLHWMQPGPDKSPEELESKKNKELQDSLCFLRVNILPRHWCPYSLEIKLSETVCTRGNCCMGTRQQCGWFGANWGFPEDCFTVCKLLPSE